MKSEFDHIVNYYKKKGNPRNIYYDLFKEFFNRLKKYINAKLFHFKRAQTFTKNRYERIWNKTKIVNWYDPNFDLGLHVFNKELFFASAGITKKIHHQLIIKEIESFKPKKVLEVGSGNGINLRILSSLFKDINFYGIDQSENGIKISNQLKNEKLIPELVKPFNYNFDFENLPTNLVYSLGDAKALNFRENEIDFVYTILALEQMDDIKLKVLKELKRVAKKKIVLIEPFPELNRGVIKYLHHRSKQYFNLNHKSIIDQNWTIEKFITNVPTKVSLGYGMLVLVKN